MTKSGKNWVAKYPTSKQLKDLDSAFRTKAENFVTALRAANATVVISATYRPKERAFLMHYAFRIARQGLNPKQVPSLSSVDIDWVHKKSSGGDDMLASINAAEDMVQAYGIVSNPALNSNHTRGLAVDMTISWSGNLAIKKPDGTVVTIKSTPRNGQNAELRQVGRAYGVLKLISDPPHWSLNGR